MVDEIFSLEDDFFSNFSYHHLRAMVERSEKKQRLKQSTTSNFHIIIIVDYCRMRIIEISNKVDIY